MNSATSSLPHVLQMIESSFPFGPNSNRYVGVSHSRQMRYSGSSMGAKNTRCRAVESYVVLLAIARLLRLRGGRRGDRRLDEVSLVRFVVDDRGVDVRVGRARLDQHGEIVALRDHR